jgi:putative transposase
LAKSSRLHESPWQNPYVERPIGTIRRECLDHHIIVLNENALRRVLKLYFEYCERTRTHLSLDKDAPIPRRVQPPELGKVVELLEVTDMNAGRPSMPALLILQCF